MGNYGAPSVAGGGSAGVGVLAMTGGDQIWLIAVALLLVATGALLLRLRFRSGLSIAD